MRVFWDETQLQHRPAFFLQRGQIRPNFEVPQRALALLDGVRALGLTPETPPPGDDAAIERVHPPEYLDFLRTAHAAWASIEGAGPEVVANIHPSPEMLANGARRGPGLIGQTGWFTADAACPVGPFTWAAARAAASCALAAAEAATGGIAYALTRPPGHHAYPARAGGHCYLNNAAIAAEHLLANGAARVATLDIDSHHGNGTQAIFWTRPDVLTVSVHGDPSHYYPWYVGHADETGAGPGEGHNLNLPLPKGANDAAWLEAIDIGLAAIERHRPDALVVSLGFDASKDEPLGFLAVTDDGFAQAARRIGALHLPTVIIQEGGYNLETLSQALPKFLSALV